MKWIDIFKKIQSAGHDRDLSGFNFAAPRLMRTISGNFAVETICRSVSDEQPAMGGILLWKDRDHFLRLDLGRFGQNQLTLLRQMTVRPLCVGRGLLDSEGIFLRLERVGSRVSALCSSDGTEWFSVGSADFDVEDPIEVGLYAIGTIDRGTYFGSFPDGTAIKFESFQLSGK